jgi:hypothetical protein
MSPRSSRSRSPRDDRRRNRSGTPLDGGRYEDAGSGRYGAFKDSQQERRVYVGNLSYDVKWQHLKDFMGGGMSRQRIRGVIVAGQVVHAEVLMLPNGMSKVGISSNSLLFLGFG